MKRGNWALYKDTPHIVVEVPADGRTVVMHEIDANGETVMEMNVKLGRIVDKLVIVPVTEVEPCPMAKLPASRRPV